MKIAKGIIASLFLVALATIASAETLNLACFYDRTLHYKMGTTSRAKGEIFAQIELAAERVVQISINKGHWCDPRSAFVSATEISFACAFELPAQRISYSFTLNRIAGEFEQRVFLRGKLTIIHYGRCKPTARSPL
jgi:hypothetical protein